MSDEASSENLFLKAVVCSVAFVLGSVIVNQHLQKSKKAPRKVEEIMVKMPDLKTVEVRNIIYPHEHEKRMNERINNSARTATEDDSDLLIERKKVVVKVPATSANLGPGFDTIGMALDMFSVFTVERSDKFEVVCEGEGAHDMPLDETNLVCFGLAAAFKKAGKEVPPLKYHLNNRIPYARGLGSSSAAIVGGLVAGLVLAGHQVLITRPLLLLSTLCRSIILFLIYSCLPGDQKSSSTWQQRSKDIRTMWRQLSMAVFN